jgi:hypothetical protein
VHISHVRFVGTLLHTTKQCLHSTRRHLLQFKTIKFMLAAAQVSPHEPCAVVRTVLSCACVVVLTEGHCQEVLESCFSTFDARDTSRYRSGEKTLKVAMVPKALEVAEALKKIAELQRGTHHIRFAPGSGTEVILGCLKYYQPQSCRRRHCQATQHAWQGLQWHQLPACFPRCCENLRPFPDLLRALCSASRGSAQGLARCREWLQVRS